MVSRTLAFEATSQWGSPLPGPYSSFSIDYRDVQLSRNEMLLFEEPIYG
jgi:hypothetical protein